MAELSGTGGSIPRDSEKSLVEEKINALKTNMTAHPFPGSPANQATETITMQSDNIWETMATGCLQENGGRSRKADFLKEKRSASLPQE
jgi:hypothetical protein